jgi:uncharacterized protein (TIGR00369 family)
MRELPERELGVDDLRELRRGTIDEMLDIQVVEIDEDRIVLHMPITDRARQALGLLHGGVHMVLAESAASLHACWGLDLSQKWPVGIEINGSHVRSASVGSVRAVGTVIRRSRSLIVHQVEIYHEETGKLLSVGRVTNYYKTPAQPAE